MPVSAVILAAGRGTRLGLASKPLAIVGGRTLVEHAVSTARAADIERIVVVVDELDGPVGRFCRARLPVVELAHAHDCGRGNGASVLAGLAHAGGRCLVMMVDHLHGLATVERLLQERGELVFAVDSRAAYVDHADATLVRRRNGDVLAIGKDIGAYDGVETGLALCQAGPLVEWEPGSRAISPSPAQTRVAGGRAADRGARHRRHPVVRHRHAGRSDCGDRGARGPARAQADRWARRPAAQPAAVQAGFAPPAHHPDCAERCHSRQPRAAAAGRRGPRARRGRRDAARRGWRSGAAGVSARRRRWRDGPRVGAHVGAGSCAGRCLRPLRRLGGPARPAVAAGGDAAWPWAFGALTANWQLSFLRREHERLVGALPASHLRWQWSRDVRLLVLALSCVLQHPLAGLVVWAVIGNLDALRRLVALIRVSRHAHSPRTRAAGGSFEPRSPM